jgi:hypothetical protein
VVLGAMTAVVALAIVASHGAASRLSAQSASSKEGKTRLSSAPCSSGEVSLGSRPGVINFSAHCHAPASGAEVELNLLRYATHGPKHHSVLNFSRRLSLTGPGARDRYGVCKYGLNTLSCQARVYGSVTAAGRIWVPEGQRCSQRVELEALISAPCNSVCLAVATVKGLVSGRPRGCM